VILVDTSAWVEYDRATDSPADRALCALIRTKQPLAVSEPILMEVLAGAKDTKRAQDLRRLLTSFEWIPTDAIADFEGAAVIYRSCRAAGVTPRGLLDCMIVNIAIRSGATLLASDRDFEKIATVVSLQIHSLA
jgi:predicted nucleic acid-binding protein